MPACATHRAIRSRSSSLKPNRKRQAGYRRDPTPEEIRARCLEIQATWSDKVREDRHWRKPQVWAVPIVQIPSDGASWPDEPETMAEE